MGVIRLPQEYADNTVRNRTTEALQSYGEVSVLIQLRHSINEDLEDRCSFCFNTVYEQSGDPECPRCLGTTFENPVIALTRVWAMYTDVQIEEKNTRQGQWQPDSPQVTFEAYPTAQDNDILVRVKEWSYTGRVLKISSVMRLQAIQEVNLRSGARYGQQNIDRVGQKSTVSALPGSSPVFRYAKQLEVKKYRVLSYKERVRTSGY